MISCHSRTPSPKLNSYLTEFKSVLRFNNFFLVMQSINQRLLVLSEGSTFLPSNVHLPLINDVRLRLIFKNILQERYNVRHSLSNAAVYNVYEVKVPSNK